MTDEQIDAAALIQSVAEHMIGSSDGTHGDGKRWTPSYIRRQGRRLQAALAVLTEEKENAEIIAGV